MFSFFKKRSIVSDISWLGVDIHSHILPGIDDGASDLSQSIMYVRKLVDLGFHTLHFTPHIFNELYPNTAATILPRLEELRASVIENNISVTVGAAAEYMVDHEFKAEPNLLCLPNSHLLIEMSYLSESPNIEQVVFDLLMLGYKVILAHPERYNFYHKTTERYKRLKEMGCIFQLNLLSVTGYYGKDVKLASQFLLENRLYDVAGTDLHHDKHLALLEKVIRNGELYSILGNYEFKNKEYFG